jgi:molybdate transport system substrate-binding protein
MIPSSSVTPAPVVFATYALRWLGLVVLALVSFGACKPRSDGDGESKPERALVVFAASSLRDVFSELGSQFDRTHPGVQITFNFAGTQQLRAQLEHGASADVLASADLHHMQELVRAGIVETPVPFCRNEPVLVVPGDSALESFEELPDVGRLVIGSDAVPVGRYTRAILERASQRFGQDFTTRVEAKVVSRELNVRQVLAKVTLGEADAGIVYRTDALAAGKGVRIISIPADVRPMADYPIARLRAAPHPGLASEWILMVLSNPARDVFLRAGFLSAQPAGD